VAYTQRGATSAKSRLCVVVNSAKLFATLSRKMLNFVGGNGDDGDELHEGVPSGRRGQKRGTTHEEPSSKGLSSISRSRSLPSEKWAMAMAQRKLYEIILHKFSGRNLLLALLVFAPAIQSPWPDLLAAPSQLRLIYKLP